MTEDSTNEEIVSENEASKVCISDEMALKLAQLAITLEEKFGNARDIEFAIKTNKIYLLQSRPVTSFATWTDYDLQHEFDSPMQSQLEVNTKGNVGEVVPGAYPDIQ